MQHAATAARSVHVLAQLSHYWWTSQWHLICAERGQDWRHFRKLPQPRGVLRADPFVVDFCGVVYVFFEELPYRFWGRTTGACGKICVMKYLGAGKWSDPAVVLERPYHLSYPFVFEWNMNYYMIPETMGNRTVELYRATDFPFGWELHRTLMNDVRATDNTLFQYESRWWMFSCREEDAPPNRDLYLYSADDPVNGEWMPHPMNPVISDVRHARCAGRLFPDGESYIRPAQDCSQGYGGAVQFRRIVALTETFYHEEPAGRIGPESMPGATGVHTWNRSGDLLVADVQERVARWRLS